MSLILCPECNAQISDKSTVCIHCGCPLIISSDISKEIELIENQLFDLNTALMQKEPHNLIYNKINSLFKIVHQKIENKANPQYDDLLFIVTKHLCYNANIITHSTVTQYFSLLNMKYVTENGFTKSIELLQDIINNSSKHICFWFPLYQFLENAPEINKNYLKILLDTNNAFGQPKINDVYAYAREYLPKTPYLSLQNNNQKEQNKPKCPICQSTNLSKISTTHKAGKIALFGIFGAGDIGKTWKCNNCGGKF